MKLYLLPEDETDEWERRTELPDAYWHGGKQGWVDQFDCYHSSNSYKWERNIGYGYRIAKYGPVYRPPTNLIVTASKRGSSYVASVTIEIGYYCKYTPYSKQNVRFDRLRTLRQWMDEYLTSHDLVSDFWIAWREALSPSRVVCVYRKNGDTWEPFCSTFKRADSDEKEWGHGEFYEIHPDGRETHVSRRSWWGCSSGLREEGLLPLAIWPELRVRGRLFARR